jgi:hypothetical protein
MKHLILALLLSASAHAQTYNIDIAFNGPGQSLFETFTGSFTYANGQVTASTIADPPWAEPLGTAPTQFSVFQSLPSGQSTYLNFIDLEGAPTLAAAGSNVWTFGFDVAGLGTNSATIGDASFYHSGPSPISCGPDYEVYSCSVATLTMTSARAAAAPEIGLEWAPLILLFGTLATARGRRR